MDVKRRFLLAFAAALLALPALATDRVPVAGGIVTVELARAAPALDQEALLAWVRQSAQTVAAFYGRFPVAAVRLVIAPASGEGVSGGRTWADGRGGLIRVRVGVATTADAYADDWVLVHEMAHLALPSLPENQAWLEEGLATYVESIARARAGVLSNEKVWAGFVKGMPNGLPAAGDHGLDRTRTWGRTYWGGALFCLLADLDIRRVTANRFGLPDALRAILASGNLQSESTAAAVLATGDRAIGVAVLVPLYERMKDAPVPTDLDALWARLGVIRTGRSVRLDDQAPEAALRRALTAPPG
jgi:predicted metalloprotease with PDZ domain